MLHIEIKHSDVIDHITVNKHDMPYYMALCDTYEPVLLEDITPKHVPASAYAFANAFEDANMRDARANTYALSM